MKGLVLTGLLLIGAVLVGASPTLAQSRTSPSSPQEYRPGDQSPRQAQPSSSNLPDWAAPSTRPPSQGSGSGAFGDDPVTNAPSPPDDPNRVPVDGGLGFLALAGAGYAVRKLRKNEDEDPTGGPA